MCGSGLGITVPYGSGRREKLLEIAFQKRSQVEFGGICVSVWPWQEKYRVGTTGPWKEVLIMSPQHG